MNAKRRLAHRGLAALPGVRAVRRPVTPDGAEHFDLHYVRTGPKSDHPLVIIPGGPGLASVAPYRGLRRHATAAGLDVIMIEHRGVGLSRHDDHGADLPPQALTVDQVVDDVAAVLDDAQVDTAVLYGTSYGSYIAAGMGVRHPNRVKAMVLDSPLLSNEDIEAMREAIRRVLWDGKTSETADLAAKIRELVRRGTFTPAAAQLASLVYGFGGARLLDRHLNLLMQGRRGLWTALDGFARMTFERKSPYRNEVDLVTRIAFRELNYGGVPDGKPLDPAVAFREMATEVDDFEAEPYDLVAEMPKFTWPTVVVSGGRDLTTPPAVAERVAALIPHSVLVRLPTAGHSALDIREQAALQIAAAVCGAHAEELAERAAMLDKLPAPAAIRLIVAALGTAAAVESMLPAVLHRRAIAPVANS